MKVKCIRNDSKTLPYQVNQIYTTGYHYGAGVYEIFAGDGTVIHAPLNGYYLEFVIIK